MEVVHACRAVSFALCRGLIWVLQGVVIERLGDGKGREGKKGDEEEMGRRWGGDGDGNAGGERRERERSVQSMFLTNLGSQ